MLVATLLTLTFVGCGSNDPLGSFKQKLSRAQSAVESSVVIQVDGRWQKIRFDIEDLKYDVTETDSLASPFTGEVAFKASQSLSSFHDEKADAESDSDLQSGGSALQDAYYAIYDFQDGSWKLREFKYSLMSSGSSKPVGSDDPKRSLLQDAFE
jgi:hypothetical protein